VHLLFGDPGQRGELCGGFLEIGRELRRGNGGAGEWQRNAGRQLGADRLEP
jgi:hypothetical protein